MALDRKSTGGVGGSRPDWQRGARPDPWSRCLVCGSHKLEPEPLSWPDQRKKLTAVCCQRCRYVHLPENHREYVASSGRLGGGMGARMGTWEVPGREYEMARFGLQVLRRNGCSVLMYGAGQSIDNHHAAKHPRVSRVAIGDLAKVRDDAEFIDISQLATEQFDIVVASEVLEHFPDPFPNFQNLFSYAKDDGIIICGTNIRDALSMQKVTYVRTTGHVSYFSPKSLRMIADHFGMHVDYRTPWVAVGNGGPRKKYVIFSRSQDVMDAVVDWSGGHMYAPSDRPDAQKHEVPAEIPTGPISPIS